MEFKLRSSSFVWVILCVLFIAAFGSTVFVGGSGGEQYKMAEEDRDAATVEKPSLWEMAKNAFSVYTSSPLRIPSYLEKVKTLFNQVQAYFFPPDIEVRTDDVEGEAGAGERVKEGVGKSFGESKLTVEGSAKSAAGLVGETVQKAKEKMKGSFTDRVNRETTEPQSEL